jgi:hypothetical protein
MGGRSGLAGETTPAPARPPRSARRPVAFAEDSAFSGPESGLGDFVGRVGAIVTTIDSGRRAAVG